MCFLIVEKILGMDDDGDDDGGGGVTPGGRLEEDTK